MRPQSPTVLDHHNETPLACQAPDLPANEAHHELFTKGQWRYPQRFQINPVQLFALQAEHESELLTLGDLARTRFSAGQLLTQRKLRQVIAIDRQVPEWFIHPQTRDAGALHTISEKEQQIALAIVATLLGWSAATGRRLVTFTHSSLYGKPDRARANSTGPKTIREQFGCSFATYKKALRLLALAQMPTLHLRHTDEHGNLTQVDRCLAIILPTVPRNANVDLSCKLPADSLARSLEPGHQLTFEMVASDPGPEQPISPPYVTTTHQVRQSPQLSTNSNPTNESPFLESTDESRIRAQILLGIRPAGLTGETRKFILPRSAASLQGQACFEMFRWLWTAQFGREELLKVSVSQRRLIDERFDAVTALLGRRETNQALLTWIRQLGRRPQHLTAAPRPHWIFSFLSQQIARGHRLATTAPKAAPPLAKRQRFTSALYPAAELLTSNDVHFTLAAIATDPETRTRTAVTTGNHAAWQMLVHEAGASLLLDAAAKCRCDRVMFTSSSGRTLDPVRIERLASSSQPARVLSSTEAALALAREVDQLNVIEDSASRATRAICAAIPDPHDRYTFFEVAHIGGRQFAVTLPNLRYRSSFELRYQRIYTRTIAKEFAGELRGLSPVLVFVD